MKKHYIDKGKSASRIPQELISTFDETVFEYSKKIYNFLINKFETEDIPLTDKSLIDIEKIYEIIAKGAKGEYTEQTPETRLAFVERALWKPHYYEGSTVTYNSPRILLSPKIQAELDEIVFAYSQGIYRTLVASYKYRRSQEDSSYNKELLPQKIQEIIVSKSTMPPISYYTDIDTDTGYYTSDVEDDEGDEALTEQPLLIRYVESNMVIGTKNLIKKTGVDVNTKDEYGRSALFYANSLHAIAMLLDQRADVNIIDTFGNNVLHVWGRKSLLTPMSHTCRDQIFSSFVDKLTIPHGEEEGPFSLINHKGQDVRYMFLLGSQYFHLSAEKRLPDIYDYNSLCSFVRNKISSPMKGSCNAYIPETVLDIILSYLNMPINDLSLEGVLSYYEKSKSSFDLSKIQNYGLPLLHRLALNTITNTPNGKNLELLKKLYELDPKQLEYTSKIGNPLDIVLNTSETIEAPKLQKEIISFFLEKGRKISAKTKIEKLTSHLGIFQEHLNKIAKTVYSSTGFPEDVYKIIIDYLPLFESLLNQLCKFSHKYLKFYPQILSKNEPWLHSNFEWA
ncbi:MAG TPA: hypothetical protein QKA37_03765 [Candidatus Megaira endosymbiont of Stentor roeselii]|nr:hypothetical protein [Candidatus Megaera endosymbiont of Stentor roeselii]